jgi:uncharacterized membrane-anchored protein
MLVGIVAVVLTGCAGPPVAARQTESVQNPVLGMLNRHLMVLNVNIEGSKKRLAEMQAMPETVDPTLRGLRALELSSGQLHQRQWILQRDHLVFAKEQLRQAKDNPGGKPQLLEQWLSRQRQYEAAVQDLRQQRLVLEQQRIQAESELVVRLLRGE